MAAAGYDTRMENEIPKEIHSIAATLEKAGHKAYLVGGCVRDLLLRRTPADWDIATDATPEKIQKLFPQSVYENLFGTVGVKTQNEKGETVVVEATTFRREGKYTDKRHPEEIRFTKTIEEDLARRDFTVNAMALDINKRLVDPYGGEKDLRDGVIRAVRDPRERFSEDALRLLRAVRLAAQLGFRIEEKTKEAMQELAGTIRAIARERVRDESVKLLMTARAADGIRELLRTGLLAHIFPELATGVGVEQNQHHIYDVFEHNVRSLEYAAKKEYSFVIRLAALFHDVGKPKARRWRASAKAKKMKDGVRGDYTFYGHQIVGARMAENILSRLCFSREVIDRVVLLVREHMFVYDPEAVTLAGVRRLLSRVGAKNMDDLIKLREADRIGSGVPKAQPYRLRFLQAMLEKVKTDPVSPKMLAIRGDEVMKIAKIEPSPRVGWIIAVLLDEALDDPAKNTKEALIARVRELAAIPNARLRALADRGKETAAKAQEKIDEEIKKKYFV